MTPRILPLCRRSSPGFHGSQWCSASPLFFWSKNIQWFHKWLGFEPSFPRGSNFWGYHMIPPKKRFVSFPGPFFSATAPRWNTSIPLPALVHSCTTWPRHKENVPEIGWDRRNEYGVGVKKNGGNSGNFKVLICWLVVGPPLWKIWKSVGMMTFPILMGNKIDGNQTTNQIERLVDFEGFVSLSQNMVYFWSKFCSVGMPEYFNETHDHPCGLPVICRFPKMGVPQNRWFVVCSGKSHENAWFGGTAILGNLHIDIV